LAQVTSRKNEKLARNLQAPIAETDNQKIPMALNDYRDFLVSQYLNMLNTGISLRENSHTLRLMSELVTSFACISPSGETEPMRATHAVPLRRIIKIPRKP
jgi:hypothetical protein